jgi:hypothetical protein
MLIGITWESRSPCPGIRRKKKQELKVYPLLCQIYKLKGRCYPCEKRGMKPGECSGVSAECLRALGVK